MLKHKCSSYSRVMVSGLEPHNGDLSILFLSPPALEAAKVRGTDQTLPSSYSLSASDMMIFGLFPPSSRVTLLRLLSAAAFWIRCPTCRDSRAGVGINSHISKRALGLHLSQHLMLILIVRALNLPRVSPPTRNSSGETRRNILKNQIRTKESYLMQTYISQPGISFE